MEFLSLPQLGEFLSLPQLVESLSLLQLGEFLSLVKVLDFLIFALIVTVSFEVERLPVDRLSCPLQAFSSPSWRELALYTNCLG